MSGRACYTALYYIMYIFGGDADAFRRFCVRCNLMGKPERFGADLTAAMDRLLLRNPNNLTGVVLRLAWYEGLTRDEIYSLTWGQVELERGLICLDGRDVPLEGDMANCLALWREVCGKADGYVAVSEKTKERVSPPHLSRVVRLALDEEGLDGVKLGDLRNQYIFRQVERRGWENAIRTAGISVTTFRYNFSSGENARSSPAVKEASEKRQDIETVLARSKDSAEGLALWLYLRGGLSAAEIVSLTWEQIDFAGGVIDLGDRRLEASEELLAVLRAERQRRADGDDAHVLLSPRARKPIRADRLSVVMRSFLLRNGVDARLHDIGRETEAERVNRKITDYCASHDGISLRECMALLDMTSAEAFRRINQLVAAQSLKRSGRRYYLYEDVIAPEDYEGSIINYIKRSGSATRLEVKNLLHIGERNAWTVLTKMVKKGVLKKEIGADRYTLL